MRRTEVSGNGQQPANTLEIAGVTYLLVEGGGRDHLVRDAGVDDDAIQAVADHVFDPTSPHYELTAGAYDRSQLTDRRWLSKTLCGKQWYLMAASDVGPLVRGQIPVYSPDCRSCLRIVGRKLTNSEPDPRVGKLAAIVAAAVVEYGSAQISGVPGDQADQLRTAMRRALSSRGFRCRTLMEHGEVVVLSDDAFQSIPEEVRREHEQHYAAAFEKLLEGRAPEPLDSSDWRFRWSAWDLS